MRQATVSEARGWCWAVFALGHLLTGCSNDSGDVGAIPDGLASQVTLGAMQTSFVGDFDGFLFKAACGDGGTGFDCLNSINTCSDGQQTELFAGTTKVPTAEPLKTLLPLLVIRLMETPLDCTETSPPPLTTWICSSESKL